MARLQGWRYVHDDCTHARVVADVKLRTPEEVAREVESEHRHVEEDAWFSCDAHPEGIRRDESKPVVCDCGLKERQDRLSAAIRADRLALLDEVMRRCGGLLRASLRERVVRDLRREIAGN